MLLGVPDETNSLQYGQIFIQLRDLNGESHIIHGKTLITKNPAHFPGDIRKLDAVDCPALHHLYECVVFPTQGSRPHSNEISGSDLDGDEVSYSSLFLIIYLSYSSSIGCAGMKTLLIM
jgi:RNA-dependent RNA polymerase